MRIEVADTGIGMDPDAVESYFCAFTQAEPASEGLGVGLWIVRQTAHALGAGIGVSSSLGRGTCVSVTLPA